MRRGTLLSILILATHPFIIESAQEERKHSLKAVSELEHFSESKFYGKYTTALIRRISHGRLRLRYSVDGAIGVADVVPVKARTYKGTWIEHGINHQQKGTIESLVFSEDFSSFECQFTDSRFPGRVYFWKSDRSKKFDHARVKLILHSIDHTKNMLENNTGNLVPKEKLFLIRAREQILLAHSIGNLRNYKLFPEKVNAYEHLTNRILLIKSGIPRDRAIQLLDEIRKTVTSDNY